MSVSDPAARRRLVWLLLTRGDLGAERLRSDGQPALRRGYEPDDPERSASASSKRASGSSRRSPNSSRS